ncbi:MAG: hypothetical protein Ta2E_08840 [Mycoplasmoidaceae bacterium]|nr:MAG: hypothetical protein Ta2E_08840 [Mycoplasmoidaceae bacterium]
MKVAIEEYKYGRNVKNLNSSDKEREEEEIKKVREMKESQNKRRQEQPERVVKPKAISTQEKCEKWWQNVEPELKFDSNAFTVRDFRALFDMEIFAVTFREMDFRETGEQLKRFIEDEEEREETRRNVKFTQYEEITNEIQDVVFSWDRIWDDMSRAGASVICTGDLMDFLACMQYQRIFKIAWTISVKETFYRAKGEDQKSMKMQGYFWWLWRYGKLKTMEFEEKLSCIEELLNVITKKSLNISNVSNPIRIRFQNPMRVESIEEIETDEIAVLQSQEVWLMEGEISKPQELKDPPTRTLS